MSRKNFLLIAAIVLIFVAASTITVLYGYRMLSNTGDRAVAAMNAEELTAFKNLSEIESTMTFEQVIQILGPPTEDLIFLAKWRGFGGSFLSEVRVYFIGGKAIKVRWLKLGSFVYDKEL